MSKGNLDDKINTEAELEQRSGLVNGKNWLRHSGQAQRIDEMLLVGATTRDIALDLIDSGLFKKDLQTAKARIIRHIEHLRKEEHMVSIEESENGVWRFVSNSLTIKSSNLHPKCTYQKIQEVFSKNPLYGSEMNFNGYFELWAKCGVKLTEKIEMTQGILDRADLQNEVCDLIWSINAVNQSNKSVNNLSHTVINELQALASILLDHKAFKKYKTPAEVVKRAERHYKGDHLMPSRFIQRQPKIATILKNYSENGPSPSVEMSKRPVKYIVEAVSPISTFVDYDDIKI